jgi:flagellar basal-body rod protein FlgG
MLRGIAQAASAMVARARQHDATANNLANAGTAGYKRRALFLRRLETATAQQDRPWLRPLEQGTYTDFSQGVLDASKDPFSLAIDGPGFFVVETPDGQAYTRNGGFTRSSEGALVTPDGYPVLGDGGPISVANGEFTVGENGEVFVDGTSVGALQIVTFADPQKLIPVGQSLYRTTEAAEPADGSLIRQGFLERANLELVDEMIRMIASFRYYETAQKAVQIQDETLGRAVNEVGRWTRS